MAKTATFSSQSRQADRRCLNFLYLLSQTRFINYPIALMGSRYYTFLMERGSTRTPGPITVDREILLI
jgi:hypothetical protein